MEECPFQALEQKIDRRQAAPEPEPIGDRYLVRATGASQNPIVWVRFHCSSIGWRHWNWRRLRDTLPTAAEIDESIGSNDECRFRRCKPPLPCFREGASLVSHGASKWPSLALLGVAAVAQPAPINHNQPLRRPRLSVVLRATAAKYYYRGRRYWFSLRRPSLLLCNFSCCRLPACRLRWESL